MNPLARPILAALLGAALLGVPSAPAPAPSGVAVRAQAALRAALERAAGEEAGEEGPTAGPADPGPIDWMMTQRGGRRGVVSVAAYERALGQAEAVRDLTARLAPELAGSSWTNLGPTNIGGRIVDVAVDPTMPNTVYAAAASGGVWKSTDAALTWAPSWPRSITQATGAMAIGSDGVIYVGTGESNPGGGSTTFGGTGLYRSKDSGATWQRVGLETSGAFGRIVVDPKDPKRVFAAASGNLFVPGGERGLYRSLDGGDTWELVLAGDNLTTGAADVSVDPKDPKNVLVTMWDHVRYPTHRMYAGPGSGVYLSNDGGTSWTRVTLPSAPAPAQVGRIGVAFAPSDPSRAYAIIANNHTGVGVGLWRSNDGGKSWTKTAIAGSSLSQSSFGWWFGRLWVNPANKDHVYVPGVSLLESTNGGDNFSQAAPEVHADQHGMAWDPAVPNRVYLGNDGGMYRSDAGGRPGTWMPALEQGWTQHYSVDVSEQNPEQVVSGLQDNGCIRNFVAGNLGRPDAWHTFALCGDGLQTLIDPDDGGITYGCSQYGSCRRGSAGGLALQPLGATTSQRRGWWVPLQFDPSDPSIMFYGGNVLNRSVDRGATWEPISPDLTRNETQKDPNTGYRIYHTITTVAAATTDGRVIYVGTDDGLLWRTTDVGQTWSKLLDGDDDDDLPNAWVTRVAVDPTDAEVAYFTFSGFRSGENAPHVVKTTDGGKTFTDISGNLPDAPVNDVVIAGSRLVVATDVGVFLSEDAGVTWLALGDDLPAVPVLDIRYHEGTKTITAATFGHGIQRATLPI